MLFVRKKDKSWRFCLDFRALNEASDPLGYTLPSIQDMLRRIGGRRPTVFAVIDFTSGYHQMPIQEDLRRFTAFDTQWGKYQWNRVPMGLKGATSYFQMVMTDVLGDLIQNICEVYIDDIIVYAQSEDELIANLDRIFAKIAAAGLVINPRKCVSGKSEVVYVGFVINKDGIRVSQEKSDVVQKIARPATLHDLRSFLGLTNYFRAMVPHYGEIARPLEQLREQGTGKRQLLEWNAEADKAFVDLKQAIDNCPTLSFIKPVHPYF